MDLEDFVKLRPRTKLSREGSLEIRLFLAVIGPRVITTKQDGTNSYCSLGEGLESFSLYVEPKVKTKFYQYVKCDGTCSRYFYACNFEEYWDGKKVSENSVSSMPADWMPADWVRTNTFIELEV